MDIIGKFLNKPKLSTFIKSCNRLIKGDDTYYGVRTSVCIITILNKYPDLIWLTSYNFDSIKRNASYYFTSEYNMEECWNISHAVLEKLHDKKLIID